MSFKAGGSKTGPFLHENGLGELALAPSLPPPALTFIPAPPMREPPRAPGAGLLHPAKRKMSSGRRQG